MNGCRLLLATVFCYKNKAACIFVVQSKFESMKTWWWKTLSILAAGLFFLTDLSAQCSICTKTASQLGKASAEGLNSGIVYLMLAPFAVAGYIGYRWWQQEKTEMTQD